MRASGLDHLVIPAACITKRMMNAATPIAAMLQSQMIPSHKRRLPQP